MSLPELQQAKQLINRSHRILLIVPERASRDALASMLALYLTLQQLNEEAPEEVSPGHVPSVMQFLPGSSQVHMQPAVQPEVVIDIAGPDRITSTRTQNLQGGLRLHLSLPNNVKLDKENVEISVRMLPYDVAIVLGASDLEKLGRTYADHADFFYHTPIINIDHRADNEHFGTVNLVDITAGSVAEVTYDLINTLIDEPFDSGIATNLYAGLVAGTESFQKPSTTPQSFQIAAKLINMEADREAVIQHLVKTKPLNLLKLVGRLYARLRFNEHQQLFWTIVRSVDFRESGIPPEELPSAVKELTGNLTGFNALLIIAEKDQQRYDVYLVLGKGLLKKRREIQTQISARRDNGLMSVTLGAPTLEEAESRALDLIKEILP